MGFGPIILAIIYAILGLSGVTQSIDIYEAALAIVSISVLAFISAGITVVYQIERLPLFYAFLLHGLVLYVDYALIYLLNGWLTWGVTPILVFSGIFVVGYFAIWTIIYSIIKKNTDEINEMLKKKQQNL